MPVCVCVLALVSLYPHADACFFECVLVSICLRACVCVCVTYNLVACMCVFVCMRFCVTVLVRVCV